MFLISRTLASFVKICFTILFLTDDEELHMTPLPSFVDKSYLERHYLTDDGASAAKRILCVIAHERPDITFSPTLFALTCILLHYLNEPSTYSCINALLRSKQRYIAQTNITYQARSLVLRDLADKYAVSLWLFTFCSFIMTFLSNHSCLLRML